MEDGFKYNKKLLKITILLVSSLSVLCTGVVSPALPTIGKYFANVSDISLKVKMMVTIPNFFIGIFAPFFGYLAKHFPKKKILTIAIFFYGITGTAGFYMPTVESIIFSRVLLGICIACIMTTATSLIADYFTDDKERSAIIGFQTTVLSVCSITYGILGGILGDFNWRLIFLLYGVAFFLIFLVRKNLYEVKGRQITCQKIIDNDEKFIQNNYGIIMVCLANLLTMILFYMVKIQLPFLIDSSFINVNSKKIAFVLTFEVIFSALISMKYKRFKKNRGFATISSIAFLCIGIGMMIINFSTTYYELIAAMMIYGIGIGLMMPNNTLWVISLTKIKDRSIFLGIFTTSTYLGKFLSPIILYPFLKYINIKYAFFCGGIIAILTSLFAMYLDDYFRRVNINEFKKRLKFKYVHKKAVI